MLKLYNKEKLFVYLYLLFMPNGKVKREYAKTTNNKITKPEYCC